MTTQPKDLMTLEEAEGVLRKLTVPLQHQISALEGFLPDRITPKGEANLIEARDQLRSITSVLHHLEAGRKECGCAELKKHMEDGYVNEGLVGDPSKRCVYFVDMFDDTPILPPISFCPWCGGKVPTTQEVKENICPGCGKPSNHMEAGTTSDHWGVWHSECEKEFWMAGTGLDDRVPPFSKRNVEVKEEPC